MGRALLLGTAAALLLLRAEGFSRQCERRTRIRPDLPRPADAAPLRPRGYDTFLLVCEQSDVLCYLNRNGSERYERLQRLHCDGAVAACLRALLPPGELRDCPPEAEVSACAGGGRGPYRVPYSGARVFWPEGPGFEAGAETRLLLDGCDVSALPPEGLRAAPALRAVHLVRNRVPLVAAGAFAGPPLEQISIVLNSVELTVGDGGFANLPHLETLVISGCRLRAISGDALHNSTRLRLLRLDGNRLGRVPAALLRGQAALTSLDLGDNRLEDLPERLLAEAPELAFVRFNGNRIRLLPPALFANNTRLRGVDLGRNGLRHLPEGLFAGLQSLRYIRLQENLLHCLAASAFRGLPLEDLDLSGNRLELGAPMEWPVSLSHLRLARNRIAGVSAAWTRLPRLTTLNLADNNITRLHVITSEYASETLEVDLRHNGLRWLRLEGPNRPWGDTRQRVLFLLGANPLPCSCPLLAMCPRDRRCSFAAEAPGLQCNSRTQLECLSEEPAHSTASASPADSTDPTTPRETASRTTLPAWPFPDYYY